MRTYTRAALGAAILSVAGQAAAESGTQADIETLKAQIQALKQSYEQRIDDLESRLAQLESVPPAQLAPAAPAATASGGTSGAFNNDFNPAIGVILNGRYADFSEVGSEIAGFAVGEEGERGREGLSIGESEVSFAANVDDKFQGSMTASIVREDGEDKVELEEAYVQTQGAAGLPSGLTLKAGRAYWTLGYLNEHHTHQDDFADRPLPNRVFLNKAYNDDGLEATYVLPTLLYTEVGGGVFRGADLPFGGANGAGAGAWSLYGRVGGDIGYNQSWRVGAYLLSGESDGRSTNGNTVNFTGDTRLYISDLRYTWAPTGNPRNQELTLQGEYFLRDEDGTYADTASATGRVGFDERSSGGYLQAVYKFRPQWRVGARYSRLTAPDVPLGLIGSSLDGGGHDPEAWALMLDWTNSEFSRLRLQYNREALSKGLQDDQFILQYIMSLGAHGAHAY